MAIQVRTTQEDLNSHIDGTGWYVDDDRNLTIRGERGPIAIYADGSWHSAYVPREESTTEEK